MAQRRSRISLEHRQCIVRAFKAETEDYLHVADTLGVNRSMARGIVARYIKKGRIVELHKGGRNNECVDDEMLECLETVVNENFLQKLIVNFSDAFPRNPVFMTEQSLEHSKK